MAMVLFLTICMSSKLWKALRLFCFITILFFSPVFAAVGPQVEHGACNGDIRIKEFMPRPQMEGKEWVDIHNFGSTSINFNGWKIDDIEKGSTPENIFGILEVNSCGHFEFSTNKSKLNDSGGDSVRILDAEGVAVCVLDYKNAEKGLSILLNGDVWEFSETPSFSFCPVLEAEESEDVEEEEVSYPDNIKITEFMPCPKKDEKEWVEIYNDNDEEVKLSDWKIDDKDGGSSPQLFSAAIKKHKYVVIELSSSKLNNSGDDEVRLLNPDGEEVDKTSYKGCITEYSYALDGEEFRLTSKATPGEDNEFDEEEEGSEENIKEDTVIMGESVEEAAVPKVSLAQIPKTFEIQNVPQVLGENIIADTSVQEESLEIDNPETKNSNGNFPVFLFPVIIGLFSALGVIIKRLL